MSSGNVFLFKIKCGQSYCHTVSCTCCTASSQFSDGAGIQPVYTPFRSVLNKRRWRLGPPSGDFSMGWMPLQFVAG